MALVSTLTLPATAVTVASEILVIDSTYSDSRPLSELSECFACPTGDEMEMSDAARQARAVELEKVRKREELQRKGKTGAHKGTSLELYANSRREGKKE